MADMLLLPKPKHRPRFLVPVALYGGPAQLMLPEDMTHQEAVKLAAVIMAYAAITPFNAGRGDHG